MRIHRRELLQLAGGAAALALGLPRRAGAQVGALEIHSATRNTVLGAIGAVGRRLFGEPGPPFKGYPQSAPRVALPPAPPGAGPPLAETIEAASRGTGLAPSGAALPFATLARLVDLTNGVTGRAGSGGKGRALRAAPSAGALYPGELYLVAERVEGLAAGLYYCSVLQRRLVRVREGSLLGEVLGALEHPPAASGAHAVLIITNVFARSRARYGNRGYRYCLVDTGHIGENLRLAAAAAGLGEVSPARFHDDRLNGLLRIDGREEAVCALHAVGPPATRGDPPEGGAPSAFRSAQRASARRKKESGEVFVPPPAVPRDEGDVVARYHAASKLVPGAPPAPSTADAQQGAAQEPPPSPLPESPSMALPSDATPTAEADVVLPRPEPPQPLGVEAAIRERRSSRRIEIGPIGDDQLAYVVESARSGRPGAGRVALTVVVHRVSGVEPGIYRALSAPAGATGPGLALERAGFLAPALRDACLGQDKAARAAVVFLMVADVAEAAARDGVRSYRDLLMEAGAMGQRIYLAAEAIGLTARNLAAFVDDRLNAVVGLDGRRRAVLHLTVMGRGD